LLCGVVSVAADALSAHFMYGKWQYAIPGECAKLDKTNR